jgi:hypothetical protein
MLSERARESLMRIYVPILLLTLLAACASGPESARYEFGVSGDRLATATTPADEAAMRQYLDRRARQVCTQGYRVVKVDTLPAENGRQIVDLDLQCNPYRPGFAGYFSSLVSRF